MILAARISTEGLSLFAGIKAARMVGAEANSTRTDHDKILSELAEMDAYAEMMVLQRGLHAIMQGQLQVRGRRQSIYDQLIDQ